MVIDQVSTSNILALASPSSNTNFTCPKNSCYPAQSHIDYATPRDLGPSCCSPLRMAQVVGTSSCTLLFNPKTWRGQSSTCSQMVACGIRSEAPFGSPASGSYLRMQLEALHLSYPGMGCIVVQFRIQSRFTDQSVIRLGFQQFLSCCAAEYTDPRTSFIVKVKAQEIRWSK